MAEFIQRIKAPSKGQEWYSTHCPFAGGAYDMFDKHKKEQGNCTHYCYSRMSEVLGRESKLPTNDAKSWYKKVKGYEKSSEPKLASIVVYDTHVAFVEDISSDKEVLTLSMSGWNSYLWKTIKVYKANNYCYNNHKLQGFILCPIDFDVKPQPIPTPTPQPKPQPSALPTNYKVVRGDNMTKICKKFYGKYTKDLGMKVVNANKKKYPTITLNYIQAGWTLVIPA